MPPHVRLLPAAHLAPAVQGAIDRAIDFLLGAQYHGWWRDFDTLAGPSDEWVSAYVACALAGTRRARAVSAAYRAWLRLRRRRWWSPGWGYNRYVPCDADSTLWVLRLAELLGTGRFLRARRARRWVGRHVRPDGAVRTYSSGLPIRLYTRLGPRVSFRGWCSGHTCVTALAASVALPARVRIVRYLRDAQAADGSWPAYWWCEAEYSTALAAVSLASTRTTSDQRRVLRAVDWTRARERSDCPASPFVTGLRLRILMLASDPTDAERDDCLDRLLASQNVDGGWSPSARLRIPPPDVVDPDAFRGWSTGGRGGGSIVLDHSRLYTTATALVGLNALQPASPINGR